VELARRVGLVSLPIDAPRTRLCGLGIDVFDEGAGDSATPRLGGGKEVLQVADVFDRGGAPMVEIMDQSHDPAVEFGDRREHRLIGIEETLPADPRGLARKVGPLVEAVVPVPQRLPFLAIPGTERTNDDLHARDVSGADSPV